MTISFQVSSAKWVQLLNLRSNKVAAKDEKAGLTQNTT